MHIAIIFSFILGTQLLVTHMIASQLYLYWVWWWLDIIMHLLGGIWLVCVWRSLIVMNILAVRRWSLWQMSLPLGMVLVAWEVLGVYVEGGFKDGYWLDTSGDILCGILGIVFGFWLLQRLEIFNTNSL